MRTDVEKMLFVGPLKREESFFRKAQKLGVIHFTGFGVPTTPEASSEIDATWGAIKILRGQPVVDQKPLNLEEARTLRDHVLSQEKKLEAVILEEKELKHRLDILRPVGPFSSQELKHLSEALKLKVQLFGAKRNQLTPVESGFGPVVIGESEDLAYFLTFSPAEIVNPKWVELGWDESPQTLEHKLQNLRVKRKFLEDQLRMSASGQEALHHLFTTELNEHALSTAKNLSESRLSETLFSVMGWVPVTKTSQVKALGKDEDVLILPITQETDETPPTCLENEGLARVGEDLVHIYDTPSSGDKDPSLWVLFSFALFFAIIVGDAGYGSLYFLLALFLWWRYPALKGLKRRMLKLLTLLAGACMGWGILANSYFGIKLDIENPLRKLSLIQWMAEKKADYLLTTKNETFQEIIKKYPEVASATNGHEFLALAKDGDSYPILDKFADQLMLELALFIGVIHIISSLLRYARRNPPNIGWVLVIVGAYLYIPVHLGAVSIVHYVLGVPREMGAIWGKDLMIWGGWTVFVLAIIQHRWKGLLEAMNLIQILSDSLSYLRLYALGLAGGIMAATINDMVSKVPLVIGILVMIAAHGVNMMLGVMGGVIHGLRLNFLEWYHYSFEGGGKRFNPLKIFEKE
jgi:Archaeal/vacuolar-type H+-ATPase subunit I